MAGSNAAVQCLKCLLFVFNTVLWAAGTTILGIGIYMVSELNKYAEVDPSNPITPTVANVFLGIGVFIVLLSIVACCCTLAGNVALLYMYSVFLVLTFLALLGCGIAWFSFRNEIQDAYLNRLNNAVAHYEEGGDFGKLVDNLQQALKCCGIANYTDWQKPPHTQIPVSCCINGTNTPCDTTIPANIFPDGCYSTVLNYFDLTIKVVGGIALGIAFFSMVGFLLSCCLARQVKVMREYQPL